MIREAQAAGELSVTASCEVLEVSASGYYAARHGRGSRRQEADAALKVQVERVFDASRRTYGSPRVVQALRQLGIRTSRKRVARLMRERGLVSVRVRERRVGLTKPGNSACFAPNLLAQDFKAAQVNQKWVADTTYVPTREGWLYLVSVMDLCNRQVVGWAMGEHHDAALAASALDMAILRRRPDEGLILHSDRGSEFANFTFQARALKEKFQLSMSGTGNCYDNASAESFFATLKLEAVQGEVFATREAARRALFDFIEVFYNRQRLHSGLDYVSPARHAA